MKKKVNLNTNSKLLRQMAEEQLKKNASKNTALLNEADKLKLIHELEVHQVELEIQNEELQLAKTAAQDAIELYDFAPMAYFTLSKEGKIVQLNMSGVQILGKERSLLINSQFGFFVSDECKPIYNLFLHKLFESKAKQCIDITLLTNNDVSIDVSICGIVSHNGDQCLITMIDISVRKQSENKLIESYSRFELAMQAADMAWWELDLTTGYVVFDKRKAEMLGYSSGKFKHYNDFMALVHPDDYESTMNSMRKHLNGSLDKYETEYRILTQSGEYKWYYDIGSVVKKDDNGKPLIVTGLVLDISLRKQTEKSLIVSENRYRKLFETAKDGILMLDAKTGIIKDVNPLLVEMLGIPSVQLIGKNISVAGFLRDQSGHQIQLSALQQNESIPYDDFKLETAHGQSIIVEFISNSYLEDKKKVIQYNFRDITKRKQAEIALKQSENHLRTLLQTIPDLIWLKDTNGVYLTCNKMFERFFGATENEIVGKTDYDFVNPELASFFRENDCNAMAAGRPTSNEEWITFADDGHPAYLETIKSPVYDSIGNIVGVLGIGRDITDRKQSEEKLLASEQRFRAIFDQSPIAMALIDFQGYPIVANLSLSKMIGYNSNELSEMKFTEFTYPDDIKKDMHLFTDLIDGKIPSYNLEKRYIHKSGNIVWANLFITALRDKNDKIQEIIGMVEDITERKKTEAEMLESETRYRAFFETSMDAILLTSPDGKIHSANQAACTIFGYAFEELISLNRVNIADDSDKRLSELIAIRKLKGKAKGEITLIRKDGTHFAAEISSSSFKNKEGLERTSMIIRDITERNNAVNALRLNEEKFRSYIDHAPDGIFVVNETGRYIDVNDSATKMSGYTKTEMLNMSIPEILSEESLETGLNHFISLVKYGNTKAEVLINQKDGTKRWWSLDGVKISETSFLAFSRDITESKNIQSKIKFQADLLKNVGQAVIATDLQNIVIYWNNAAESIYGWTAEEALGQNIVSLTPSQTTKEQAASIMKELNSGNSWSGEFLVKRKDGSTFMAYVTDTPIVGNNGKITGVIGISSDITERKLAEDTLRKLSSAVEQTVDSIIITDSEGLIEYVNHAFEVANGYTSDEVIGKTPRILKSGKSDTSFYEKMWKTILSGKVFRGEMINKRKNGELYCEEKTISPIFDNNMQITHFVGSSVDITERKYAEQELIKAKVQAEESDRLKSAFLANMSHEIRTPMSGILGFTELLKEPKLSGEEQQEYIGIIEKSGARMLNIINDIMSISKVESGQMEVSVSESNVNEQNDYIYTFFKPEAELKGLQFSIKNSLADKDAIIFTDREKLYAILTNLVKNAIKFTPKGSIEFGYEKKGNYLEFFVKDSGIGIPKEKQQFIFERFRQGSESLSRNYEGAGLGLSISKAYVEMLGGSIWIDSETGIGSVFYFTLPYNVGLPDENQLKTKTMEEVAEIHRNPEISGLKILIADDDELSRMLITLAVKKMTKELLTAETGLQALEACQNHSDIDLVIMDVKMPDMDGYEATRQIRKLNTKVVIVIQTAFALSGDREKALEAGCTDYISKPYSIASLVDVIKKHIK